MYGMVLSYGPGAAVPGASAGPQRMTAVTREDGSYELLVDEPGKVMVAVETLDRKTRFPNRLVEIPDADSYVLDLSFSGATVVGQVVDKDTEQGIGPAFVYAALAKAVPGGGMGSSASTGADGRFQLELEPGEYKLRARAEDRSYGEGQADVSAGAGGAPEVRLALARGLAIKGKVVDIAGRGIGGITVSGRMGEGPTSSTGLGQTLPDGTFEMGGLRAEPYNLMAGSNLGTFAVRLGVRPAEATVTLTLRPGGQLRLQVQDAAGLPVEGARPIVAKVGGAPVAFMGMIGSSDGQGMAELVVPAGAVEVAVTKGQLRGTVSVGVGEGGSANATVTLKEEAPKTP